MRLSSRKNGRFHLREVRVHRRRQGGGRAEADAQVEAGAGCAGGHDIWGVRAAAERVGLPFDTARRRDARIEHEMAPSRHSTALAPGLGGPFAGLAAAPNGPPNPEAPHLARAIRRADAHLRKRNPEFRRPPLGRDGRPDFPHGVEVRVRIFIVEKEEILLDA